MIAGTLKTSIAVALIVTSLWTALYQLGWLIAFVFALALALDLRPQWFVPVEDADAPAATRPVLNLSNSWLPPGLTRRGIAIGAAICAPVLLHLFLTRHEEFPFGGDEGYQFSATRAYALFLRQTLPIALAWAIVVFVALRCVAGRFALTLFIAGLYAASFLFPPNHVIARYPASFYFLAAPLNVLSTAASWRSPFQANHLVNALSVPVWLFILRPAFLRRWPDWTILPLGVLLFYQPSVVYYFAGGLLEPWALIFLLLAFEAALVLPQESAWIAVVLAGWSAIAKEPGIIALPFVWLLAMKRANAATRLRQIALGAAAVTPFLIYYVVRRHVDDRPVALVFGREILNPQRVATWIHRTHDQFGTSGAMLLALVAAYALVGLWMLRREPRVWRFHAAAIAAAAALLGFFFVDQISSEYVAYSRFMLYPLFLLGLLILPLGIRLAATAGAVAAVILALQVVPLGRALALDRRPPYARNSREWVRVPIFYPIRNLLERVAAAKDGPEIHSVRLLTPGVDMISAPVAYPDLNRRFAFRQDTVDHGCNCAPAEAVFYGVEYRGGMALGVPADQSIPGITDMCLKQMHVTCGTVLEAFHDTGDLVGAAGIPRR